MTRKTNQQMIISRQRGLDEVDAPRTLIPIELEHWPLFRLDCKSLAIVSVSTRKLRGYCLENEATAGMVLDKLMAHYNVASDHGETNATNFNWHMYR